MRKLLILLLLTAPAFAQRGSSISSYVGPVDSNGCPTPNVNYLHTCIYETSEIKISSYGKPYQDPANMMTSQAPAAVTSVFGRKGDIKQQVGDYNFGQILGQLLPLQLPALMTCSFSISSFMQDGKGNASGTIAITKCQ